ncbi:3-oxoacyl-[acyl-carrier-protein] synthase II [Actinomadura meyerae]|uniref:3-oxoacyl-[acyl-carrier-protein] synthase II n=1 Tax=Actinomadura meyerae TaxID=240840 RepID=A0A239N3B1_9ACTN|nr:beta-ketoacyl-[acyl-carrier-protein] synthase family protein [Actinomadura meyerae]SNT48668.1 3-oxoacyl-[acyl-carrier-protein] synthase II [Actinomadura meyerae]
MTAEQRADGTPRVVVTGFGVKSPAGGTPAEVLATVLAGKSQAVHLPELLEAGTAVSFGCPARPLDEDRYFTRPERRRLDRMTKLGAAAAADAFADALGDAEGPGGDPARRGVYVGTAAAGLASTVALGGHEHAGTLERVPVPAVPRIMPNAVAANVSIRHGCEGPCLTFSTGCASGATAIGEAVLAIRAGRIDTAVAGGVDAILTPFAMAAFARIGALARRDPSPHTAGRPFDAERDGFVVGEAAAFLVLERADRAAARGARAYGEVAGYACASDAAHLVAPRPDGAVAARCMAAALADAGLDPARVGHISAHATGTRGNDGAEALAIDRCFGGRTPPVTATKGVTGHVLGAGGALQAMVALLSAADGLVPPTANFAAPDAETALVDVVHGEPRAIAPAAPALSNSFGFGGHDATLVLTPA